MRRCLPGEVGPSARRACPGATAEWLAGWCFVALFAWLAAAAPAQDARTSDDIAGRRALLLERLNVIRFREGCSALGESAPLARVAQLHAEDMARRGYFDHENPDGERPHDRVRRSEPCSIVFDVGENLARATFNSRTPFPESVDDTFKGWLESPGHFRNLVNPKSTHVGFGVAEVEREGMTERYIVELTGIVAGEWEVAPSLDPVRASEWRAYLHFPAEFSLRSIDHPDEEFPDPVVEGLRWVGARPLETTAARGPLSVKCPPSRRGRHELTIRRMGERGWWPLLPLESL